jgi:hypothetical protein
MTVSSGSFRVALLLFWSLGCLPSSPVDADVAKPEDVAACNIQAHDAIRLGSTSRGRAVPNTSDHDRAAQARQSETSMEMGDAATRSPDAQLEGMDGDGAKDPVFQAAFRGCMRRKGF